MPIIGGSERGMDAPPVREGWMPVPGRGCPGSRPLESQVLAEGGGEVRDRLGDFARVILLEEVLGGEEDRVVEV
jgi:hypothetical protein